MQTQTAIIGDIHGCLLEFKELDSLIPKNIKRILVGDLTDKGPYSNEVLEYAASENMILVNSNHDEKYIRFIRKNRAPEAIDNAERRSIFQSLSAASKEYLLTAKPFVRLEIKNNPNYNEATIVHGGIGPNHNLYPLDGKTFNEILRLRYVDEETMEKVSTVHKPDGTWGPEHENVVMWQDIYDGRYGLVIHGHSYMQTTPLVWPTNVVSIDTGAVYGGNLTAMILDLNTGAWDFIQVKARRTYV